MNNKGLTLVELIISVAILGILCVACLGFLVSGSNSYNSVSGNVNLQYRSQLAMGNITERLIDCNAGVDFHDGTLYILNLDPLPGPDGKPAYTAYIYRFDSNDNAIYYGERAAGLTGETYALDDDTPAADLLAEGVSGFQVTYDDNTAVAQVAIHFHVRSKTFASTQTVALRNHPPAVIEDLP